MFAWYTLVITYEIHCSVICTQHGEHILHSSSLWKMGEHDAVAAAGHLRSVSPFSIISLNFALIYLTSRVKAMTTCHVSPTRVLLHQLPRQRSEVRPSVTRTLDVVEWLSICADLKSRDDSRWGIVGRRTAARSHAPSRRSVPHSWSFRAPPRAACHWPVRRHARFSTVTAECGRGRGNKQNSWGEFFPLIASLCTTTFVPQFISHLQKCTLLNSRPYLRDSTVFATLKSMFSRSL